MHILAWRHKQVLPSSAPFCKVLDPSLIVPLTLMSCLPSKLVACSWGNQHQWSLHRHWRRRQSARNNKADIHSRWVRVVCSMLSSSYIRFKFKFFLGSYDGLDVYICDVLDVANIQTVYTPKWQWHHGVLEPVKRKMLVNHSVKFSLFRGKWLHGIAITFRERVVKLCEQWLWWEW